MPDRGAYGPLRESTNSVADPVFYLKSGEGELIPPKVRGTPSGVPYALYNPQYFAVNRNSNESNEFLVILDK